VAVQVTVLLPSGKHDPDGGTHCTVAPGQLSLAAGVAKVATAQLEPGLGVCATTVDGQVIVGSCVSFTVTLKVHIGPTALVQVTVVLPTGKKDPEAGTHMIVPQLPVGVGAGYVTFAPH